MSALRYSRIARILDCSGEPQKCSMTLREQRHTRGFAKPGAEDLDRGVGHGEAYRDGDGTCALPRVADAREDDRGIDGAGRVRGVPEPPGVIRKDASAARRWAASLVGGAPVHDLEFRCFWGFGAQRWLRQGDRAYG